MKRLCQRSSCATAVMLVSAFVTGCATHAPRVNCGGRLEPINSPVPAPVLTTKPVPAKALVVP